MPAVVTRSGISFRLSLGHLTAISLALPPTGVLCVESGIPPRCTIFRPLRGRVLGNLYEPLVLSTAEAPRRHARPPGASGRSHSECGPGKVANPIGYTLREMLH